ncbi:MAG: lipoyl(octanoyl) transferase LipB [Bacteroidetes bacterium]|nr:lipoyl(octanoyl) transferase LipB [Bacteroidota bacterium]
MDASGKIIYKDLGLIDYKEAWDYQEVLFDSRVQAKIGKGAGEKPLIASLDNLLLFCEHPHVITLGKSGSMENLLMDDKFLKQRGVDFYRINRGGDITYHGPGQIVGYPVFDLEQFGIGVKKYIELLEEAVIKTLALFGMDSGRLEGATGVWLEPANPGRARKICAIGVRSSRHITMHGFAFNVNTDISYYNLIHPCGFTDKGVTSMEKELGTKQDMNRVKEVLRDVIVDFFENLSP